MTFLEQQTEVGDLLNMTIGTTSTVTATQVKRDLNTAKDRVFNRLLASGQNYRVRLAKADLVADQELYGLPDDFRKLVRVEIGYESSSLRYKADRIDINFEDDPIYASYSTADPKYSMLGEMIRLYPSPTSAVTDGLWMYYIENPADMTADADLSTLPFEFDYLLPLYAAAKGKYKLGLRSEGDGLMMQFEAGLSEMENDLIERNIDDSNMMIVRDDYVGL